jgi:hypothetical protein
MAIVDPGETRIAGASAFVEESAVGLGPGPAVIEANPDRLMGPSRPRMGVGEKQDD